MLISCVLASAFFFLHGNTSGSQGLPAWVWIGPGGGSFYSITINSHDGKNIFVGSGAYVFRSTNGGSSWTRLSEFVSPDYAHVVRSDPNSARLILLSNENVYRSTDSGASWVKLSNHQFVDVGFHRTNPNILYGVDSQGVQVSRDGGMSWQRQANQGYRLGAAVVSFVSGRSALYVLLENNLLLKSTDQGASWQRINQGLGYGGFVKVLLRENDEESVYFLGKSGIFRSDNGGRSWLRLNEGYFDDLVLDPFNASIIYAVGVPPFESNQGYAAKSTDGGKTWYPLPLPQSSSYYAVATDTTNPKRIFVAAQGRGIYRSLDSGDSWHFVNAGLNALGIPEIFTNGNAVIAHSREDVFERRPIDRKWTTISPSGFLSEIDLVTGGLQNPYPLIAEGCCPFPSMYLTYNSGKSWSRIDSPGGLVRFDPRNAHTFYVISDTTPGIKTTDGGKTWKTLGYIKATGLTDFEISPSNPNILWVGTQSPYGNVFRSTNGGKSWTMTGQITTYPISAVVPDPKNFNVAYVATETQTCPSDLCIAPVVYKTTNGGTSWSYLQLGLSNITVDPVDSHVLYTFGGGGVSTSKDNGVTWTKLPKAGLPANVTIYTLVVDGPSENIMIGTDSGVYVHTQ